MQKATDRNTETRKNDLSHLLNTQIYVSTTLFVNVSSFCLLQRGINRKLPTWMVTHQLNIDWHAQVYNKKGYQKKEGPIFAKRIIKGGKSNPNQI